MPAAEVTSGLENGFMLFSMSSMARWKSRSADMRVWNSSAVKALVLPPQT